MNALIVCPKETETSNVFFQMPEPLIIFSSYWTIPLH